MLDRDAILNSDDAKIHEVEVPEWGGTLRLRELSGDEAMQLFADQRRYGNTDPAKLAAKWIVISAVDDAGNKLFTAEDVPRLRTKNFAVLNRIVNEMLRFNHLDEAGTADAEKN